MKSVMILCALVASAAVLTGCDWTFGGGVDSWNSRWNWANFSGVYRATGGGLLVSDFTAVQATTGRVVAVTSEQIEVGNGSRTVFSGTLRNRPVEPGSVTIRAAGFTLSDNGSGGLAGDGKTGAITYGTGAWSITLTPAAPDAGSPITASYRYLVAGTEGGERPGSTSRPIHSLTVHQEGERLQITDNNGATFAGKMGSIRGTSGYDGSGPRPVGETIIAQFSAAGVSAAGIQVKIVGTLEGVLGAAGEGGSTLANRRMTGTWIESGGRTGDINGSAGTIAVPPPAAGAGGAGGTQ